MSAKGVERRRAREQHIHEAVAAEDVVELLERGSPLNRRQRAVLTRALGVRMAGTERLDDARAQALVHRRLFVARADERQKAAVGYPPPSKAGSYEQGHWLMAMIETFGNVLAAWLPVPPVWLSIDHVKNVLCDEDTSAISSDRAK
jgi:hypothetical protein